MTSRELLRDVSAFLLASAAIPQIEADGLSPFIRAKAAGLRALADRLDAEERLAQQKTNESIRAENAGALATWHMISSTIARLDAPSGRVMPGKETT